MPNVSTLNYYGTTAAWWRMPPLFPRAPAGTNGAINVYESYPIRILFDINGYFATPRSGLEFYRSPLSHADTRNGTGFNGQSVRHR